MTACENAPMCGLAGFIDVRRFAPAAAWPSLLVAMSATICHRGPDDEGQFIDERGGVGLAFRRLSIIDLSPAGHQPMPSADGRFMLAFNGEIYNFATLRAELGAKGHRFRGRSDTEVMLAAFGEWGVVEATKRFNGMFAYALWDRDEWTLHLARDRMGEKPLYYGRANGVLLFGSELKALRAHPAFDATLSRAAIDQFMRFAYVGQPRSIYERFRKVPPATILSFCDDGEPAEACYWSLHDVAMRGEREPFRGTVDDALIELESLLTDSVRLRMIADVPLGAFLSGGIDSSLVVSLMRNAGARHIRTFSIGFAEQAYDEAPHAKAVAHHLGTEHTEAYVSAADALEVIPRLPAMFDEPFGDSSAIATHLVARLARQSVTVSLSGDGGDELFGGYNRYVAAASWWRGLRLMPRVMRRVAAGSIAALSPDRWQRSIDVAGSLIPRRLRVRAAGEKMHKLARVLRADDATAVYANLTRHWQNAPELVLGARESASPADHAGAASLRADARRMMYLDMTSYLPDDILVKVDRATMAVSLEGRIPLLDPRVIELAWRLPVEWKVRGGEGKWLLRKLLYKHVPQSLVDRPKMGFGLPIDAWLRGPLREWAEALLDEDRLRREGIFEPAIVRKRWREHLDGRGLHHADLWNALMFQAWLEASRG
jgi:asparagine synthase (glutamine-hydrolysing)